MAYKEAGRFINNGYSNIYFDDFGAWKMRML